MMGGVFVWIQHQGSTTCPYCLQTISGNALVCRHCSSDLTRRSQETPLSKQRCPYCVETISVNALVCPRCGRDLPERSLEDDELRLVWL
jgi:hypothetical protein